jgi:hypothetical protein
MIEFGQGHPQFRDLANFGQALNETAVLDGLAAQLEKSVDVLDITSWQKQALKSINITSIKQILLATDFKLQQAYYVGEVRSRRIRMQQSLPCSSICRASGQSTPDRYLLSRLGRCASSIQSLIKS